jgi:hypothetical protein
MEDLSFKIINEKNNLLDKYCTEIKRDTKEILRSLMIYENKAFHDFSSMNLYNSSDIIEGIVKKYTEIGFNEIIIPYPIINKEIPLFEKITQEVIPELRERY